MPTLVLNGTEFELSARQSLTIKNQVLELKPGEALTLDLENHEGDASWVFIPYGVAVVIHSWE